MSEETFSTNRTFNANRRAIHKGKKVIIGDSSSGYGLPIDIRTCCHKLVGAEVVEEAAGNWEVCCSSPDCRAVGCDEVALRRYFAQHKPSNRLLMLLNSKLVND